MDTGSSATVVTPAGAANAGVEAYVAGRVAP